MICGPACLNRSGSRSCHTRGCSIRWSSTEMIFMSSCRGMTALPLVSGCGAGDLQRQQVVIGQAELAQNLVGVLGELWGARQARRCLVELNRVAHQLTPDALRVDDFSDVPVDSKALVLAHGPGVLYRCPLALHALEGL